MRYDPDADKVDEDQALMERIIAAVEATESYESFVLTETYSIAGSATIIPLTYMQTETSYVHRVSHVIRGNSPNVQSFFTIRSQQHEFEEEMITNIVQGEIRFVDNTYYLTAEAIKGNELSAEVSDGWVMFTADSSQEVLRDLLMPSVEELDSDELWGALIDNSVTIDTSNLDAVGNLIDFRISQDVLEDGTPVDVITMSFDFDRIIQRSSVSSSPEDEPTEADIERELLRNIQFEVSFFIDEQGRLVGRHDYIKTFANSADLAQNSDEEDDQTAYPEIEIRVEVQENKTTFYTNINEALTPVEAPADAVPAE
ncbi:MAG: hypothetical protein CUN55_00315 [Phototrophicales bacterium]|nr:MAG: hypothetical protein CUN55_00315 [Phototrophicales bacterium]